MNDSAKPSDESPKPPRRRRYVGTHPRRFEERYKELDPARHPETFEHVLAKGNTPAGSHVPIMVAEVLRELAPRPGENVYDGTLGFGGHAAAFLDAIAPDGRLVGVDCDGRELERTRARLARYGDRLTLRRSSFAGVGAALRAAGLESFDVVFVDLGVSSMQIDDPRRGFSFKRDGPLDMRMDERRKRTAADLVATLGEAEIEAALRDLADEPDAAAIAAAIVRERVRAPILTTLGLARVVLRAKGLPERVKDTAKTAHPAARSFQALRILTNDEFAQLEDLLRQLPSCLSPRGRAGFLAFHSGEERILLRAFAKGRKEGVYAEAPGAEPMRAGAAERGANPRSSPARFHVVRRA